jgi:hypothetical protein
MAEGYAALVRVVERPGDAAIEEELTEILDGLRAIDDGAAYADLDGLRAIDDGAAYADQIVIARKVFAS